MRMRHQIIGKCLTMNISKISSQLFIYKHVWGDYLFVSFIEDGIV